MTPKKMLVVNVNEIQSIDLRCECGSVLTVPVTTQTLVRDMNCPNCKTSFWRDGSQVQTAVFYLIQGIRGVSEHVKELAITYSINEISN